MVKYNYCVVIGAYGKPPNSFYETISKLISKNINTFIIYNGDENYYHFKNELVMTKKVKNYGMGYSLNVGIALAKLSGFNLFTILDDDVIILDDFDKNDIIDYYDKNCTERDILWLPSINEKIIENEIKLKFVVESGVTFSDFIGRKLTFRTDFIMDQLDLLFCYDLRRILHGRIIPYNKRVISIYPVGRGIYGKINFIPNYRLYLLTRNSLTNFIERRDAVFLSLFVKQVIFWFFKGIQGHEKKIFKAFFYGVYDALKHRLGVTDTLQELSNNRFDK